MYELAIAQSIVSTVESEVKRQNLLPVTQIAVRIGALNDIVPDALIFNFETITRDTPFEQPKLVVEHVELKAKCKVCNRAFEVKNLFFSCPNCNSGQVELTQVKELDISYIEVGDFN